MSKRIEINTKQLKDAIQTSSFTASKEKDNVLSNTLVEIENNTMKILSKNPVTKSTQIIKIDKNLEKSSILINPNILFNILKELKDEITQITIDENKAVISNQNFKTTIKTINKELYPQEQPLEKEFICSLNFNRLKHLMKSTTPYPDKNDISREYTGILIEIKDSKLKATSTDHFRLINVVTDIESTQKDKQFIIENDGGNLITKIDMEDEIKLYKELNSIELKDSGKSIESKIIKGDFPNYETILLKEEDSYITVDRDEFLSSVRRVSIISTQDEIEIKLYTQNKEIEIISQNSEGEESIDKISINKTNSENDISIKLNSKFLMNFLSQITTDDVSFYYRSAEEPIMLKAQDDNYIYNYIMTPITQ